MADRFDRFTERAKRVLSLAREEARRFNHNYIGNEHLLLGLVAEGHGIASKVLANFGVELHRVREAVLFRVRRGDQPVTDDIAFTPRARKVIEQAIEEAQALNHSHVGTEHLLLGLLRSDQRREAGWIAIGMLESMGIDPEQVRQQVLQVVGPGARSAGQAKGQPVVRTRDNVVTCRVDDRALDALDALVEAGVYTTRSEAAARLIVAGMEANRPLLDKVYGTVAEIRRLREQTQQMTQEWRAAASTGPRGEGPVPSTAEESGGRPAGGAPGGDAPPEGATEP